MLFVCYRSQSINVVPAYGIRHYSSLTLPLNPPPQVGDFGRYAPKVESATVVEIKVFYKLSSAYHSAKEVAVSCRRNE